MIKVVESFQSQNRCEKIHVLKRQNCEFYSVD